MGKYDDILVKIEEHWFFLLEAASQEEKPFHYLEKLLRVICKMEAKLTRAYERAQRQECKESSGCGRGRTSRTFD